MADNPQDVQDETFMGSGEGGMFKDFKMPTQSELLAAIEKMGLDEETKQELRDGVLGKKKLGGPGSRFAGPATEIVPETNTSLEVIMLLSLIAFVFLVLVVEVPVMSTKRKLKSAKELKNMFSIYKPKFKELLRKKIESRISEEKIKIVCTVIFVISTAIFLLVFVFFGYKLYKSLVDRERRREEKRRQKLQKKKK